MRSYRWLIITGALVIGVAALAIAVGAIWLNSFIHSPGFRTEVESRASQSLGAPVQIEAVDFDVFHGIKLKGVVTQLDPNHSGGQGAVKIKVAQVNCTYSLWDLLGGKLGLDGVVLDQPQITLTREPNSSEAQAALPPAPETASTPSGTITSPSTSSGSSHPFQFILDRVKIKDGTVTFTNPGGAAAVTLQGINAEANTSGYYSGKDVTGTLRIAQAGASNMTVTDFSTPFTYHSNSLVAKQFDASAFSGKLAGDFQMDGSGPSVLNLNARGLNLEQLTAAAHSGSTARITGSLDFQSKWRGAESDTPLGEGDAQITNGKVEGVKILQEAGRLLRIDELSAPVISKAQTHFVVRNRHFNFNGLQLDSTLFRLTGNGSVAFEGAVNADLVLIMSRDGMAKLPHEIQSSFVQQPDGSGSIAFRVTGTTSDPQTDLPERLLLQNGVIKNQLNKVLNKFLH
jgi:uncharacterized protein involved in outer membrane biogenesis